MVEEVIEKNEMIEARKSWARHYVQVKALIEQPKKKHTVEVKGKTKSGKPYSYTYKYADLADVDKAVIDACKKVKDKDGNVAFSYYFDINNGQDGVSVQTILIDSSGYEKATNKVWFRNVNIGNAQDTASLISYAKRYSLSGAFGIASEDDDDVQNLSQQNQVDVDPAGLRIIWNAYLKHDPNAKEWLTQPHDADTASTIKRLSKQYKALNQNQKEDSKQEAISKIKRASEDKIKELVDGADKEDPHADEAVDSELTEGQQNLFDGVL